MIAELSPCRIFQDSPISSDWIWSSTRLEETISSISEGQGIFRPSCWAPTELKLLHRWPSSSSWPISCSSISSTTLFTVLLVTGNKCTRYFQVWLFWIPLIREEKMPSITSPWWKLLTEYPNICSPLSRNMLDMGILDTIDRICNNLKSLLQE